MTEPKIVRNSAKCLVCGDEHPDPGSPVRMIWAALTKGEK